MKLTEADVIAILHDDGRTEAEVAAQYGVQQNTINRIRTGTRCASIAPHVPRWFKKIRATSAGDVVAQRSVTDPATGCVNWTGALQSQGYGLFSFRGRMMLAHRAAYEAANGPIPDGLLLMHACDNPRCCNPAHLTPGTDQDNKADCVAKGRQSKGEAHSAAIKAALQRRSTMYRKEATI